jgi:hypothetical protein
MSDERTPLVHTDGDCECGQFHPTDERTPTDCRHSFPEKAHPATPTAEPVTEAGRALTKGGYIAQPAVTLRETISEIERQAAQRSTAERPWKEWFEGCQQARAEADAKLITLRAEVERLYTRLVVDGNDVDVNAYRNDPIYKGIVYRIHRGTPRAALAAALVEKENPDER